MSINNIAIHHANRLSGQNSIGAMCLKRLEVKRDLEVGPGYCVKKKKRVYFNFTYRDILGNPCKRKDLAALYGVAVETVRTAYKRSDDNFLLANIDLMKRLKQ
jgi:hypothetical protein